MTPEAPLTADLIRDAPVLADAERVDNAIRQVLASGLPALPVVDGRQRLAGIFGEQELLGALFPGYLKTLSGAAFVRRSLDHALDAQSTNRDEPISKHMNTERVRVRPGYSDAQVAETFMHHPVPIVPVVDEDGRPVGVITRADFTRRVGERLGPGPESPTGP